MLPCPAESTNRSRSGHWGLRGLWRRCRVHRTYPIVAAPMGRPGCPEFAFWTASMDSVRIVLMQRSSIVWICVAIPYPPPTASRPPRQPPSLGASTLSLFYLIWSGIAVVQTRVLERPELRLDRQVLGPRRAIARVA